MNILITGGTGYVAQFALEQLISSDHEFIKNANLYIAHSTTPWEPTKDIQVKGIALDLTDKESIKSCLTEVKPDLIVHTAALSSPGKCEKDPALAEKVNCPSILLDCLEELSLNTVDIIYLSTDQVYGGEGAPFSETDTPNPLNAYAQSKLKFEQVLSERWGARGVILRCSNIYGPLPPYQPTPGTKFLQWLDGMLRKNQTIELFSDEYRSFVFVKHVAKAIEALIVKFVENNAKDNPLAKTPKTTSEVYNCGGPEGLNRVDVAERLVTCFDIPKTFQDPESNVEQHKIVPTPRAKVNLGYDSGLNIIMDSSKLEAIVGKDKTMNAHLLDLSA